MSCPRSSYSHQSYGDSRPSKIPLSPSQQYYYNPRKLGDVPCFWGFDDSYGYETWIDDLERLFSCYDMTNMQMYLYVK